MESSTNVKKQFAEAKKQLAEYFYSEIIRIEAEYASGQANSALTFGSLYTGNWSQVQASFSWLAQNIATDGSLAELCSQYPAVAPNLLNALQSPDERIRWLELAIKNASQLGENEIVKAHLGNMALTCRTAGRLEKQLQCIEELINLYSLAETAETAAIQSMLGEAYRLSSRYADAIQVLEQALPILEKNKHPLTTYTYHNLGITYRNLGNLEKSVYFHELEKEVSDQERDWTSVSRANLSLGILYQEKLEIEKAIGYYAAAQVALEKEEFNPSARNSYIFAVLPSARRTTISFGFSTENWQKFNKIPILGNRGALEAQIGNYVEALNLLNESIRLCQDLAQKRYEAIWLHKKGMAHFALGEYEQAISCQNRSREIAQSIGAVRAIGFADFGLGTALIAQSQLQQSAESAQSGIIYFLEAFDIAQKSQNLRDLQEWGSGLADAYLIGENLGEAIDVIQPLTQIHIIENKYRVLALYGIILTYTQDHPKAQITIWAALQETERLLQNGQHILDILYIQGRLLCHLSILDEQDRDKLIREAFQKYKNAIELSPLALGHIVHELCFIKNLYRYFPQHEQLYSDFKQLFETKVS